LNICNIENVTYRESMFYRVRYSSIEAQADEKPNTKDAQNIGHHFGIFVHFFISSLKYI